MHRELAKITKTFLGVEDHGIFTSWLDINFESGSSTSVGSYCLDEPIRDAEDHFLRRVGRAQGMQFVMDTIKAVGAPSWEKIPGTMIYVLYETEKRDRPLGIQGLGFGAKQMKPFLFSDVFPPEG